MHCPGQAELPEAPRATFTSAVLLAALRKSTPTDLHTVHAPEVWQMGVVELSVNDWFDSFAATRRL